MPAGPGSCASWREVAENGHQIHAWHRDLSQEEGVSALDATTQVVPPSCKWCVLLDEYFLHSEQLLICLSSLVHSC